jgi:hypothetical protein
LANIGWVKNHKFAMKTSAIGLLFILISYSVSSYAQQLDEVDINRHLKIIDNEIIKIDNLSNKVSNLNDRVSYEEKLNERTLESISKQLDAASYNLTVFGILFAIAAIGLGGYVTIIERKIVKINEENKVVLQENQKIKNEVKELNRLIQNDIQGLFVKIRREETVHILDRLVRVPKDISNLMDSLLSRELENEDFTKLKHAYTKLCDNKAVNLEYIESYKLLFFQHFLNLAMKDELLRSHLRNFFSDGITSAFENDILKSTNDFFTAVVEIGFANCKQEINYFFKGLGESEYLNNDKVFDVIFTSLKSRENRFEIYALVDNTVNNRDAKIRFGNLLFQNYSDQSLSKSEEESFADLSVLKDQLKKEIEQLEKAGEEKRKRVLEKEKARKSSNPGASS